MADLVVTNLCVDYRTETHLIHAVRNVSFRIDAGERVALVGESGSGKTTTALALMQMINAPGCVSGGSAFLGNVDLLALRGDAVRQSRLKRVSYIPQGAMNSLNPLLRIQQQIIDGLRDHGVKLGSMQERARTIEVLKSVGLPATVADAYPHQLSGGMKQRVCIAIGIVMKPDLIIADEPTSALDVITQQQVMATLIDVQEQIGCGLILIGHDMGLMAQATHRIIVMQDGEIVEDSSVRKLFAAARHAYSRMLIESVPTLGQKKQPKNGSTLAKQATGDLLAFEGVSKVFGSSLFGGSEKTALDTCSFRLSGDHPQIVSIVGQSGSGKTTLARMVLGFERPSTGQVRFRSRPLDRMTRREHLTYRREVQAIFQDPYGSFNPFYKVDRALSAPLRHFGLAQSRSDAVRSMESACSAVGLNAGEILGRFPHELSGGQRQRLMVARALMLNPRLIVADEPVSMVDASLRMTILRNLQTLKEEHAISVLYITHDLATAYHVSDYVLVLHNGQIVEAGRPEQVIEQPEHPYTQSLVAAIPWPDPDRRWASHDPNREDWTAPAVFRGQGDGFELHATVH